ncbi:hypothetical protein S7711_06499 [Stachybotrys chartarum IBT 7711]|uniref:Xylanolytic transcriptional activator regulatory domain-containing protein n=1 Tax=Stachybotrys chartarum (strain CBS 109288 / IBT 7711) TaxID=1280523 RepID=A0A084BB83_STACB|nr:hypothetical protein S7711_06499 [Stachybotrys chartarum IBT 7711]
MDTGAKRVEKRNRPPVSREAHGRFRRLKCNRGLPCDSCVRRDKSSSCTYAVNANRTKTGPSKPRDVKDRLSVLENLVSSLLSGNAVIQPAAPSDADVAPDDAHSVASSARGSATHSSATISTSSQDGTVLTPESPHLQETGDGQVNYIDPSHWLSILDDIKEVREHLSVASHPVSYNKSRLNEHRGEHDSSFLFNPDEISTMDDILRLLPPQPTCDLLLSWYFSSRFMVLGIVHPGKFQDEYAAFWESPSTTSPLWMALLLSILAVSASLRRLCNAAELEGLPPIKLLQQSIVKCLVLGRYATANAHALEAFLLHLQCCLFSPDSLHVDLWFEMGTIIRLAFRMGYNRDPSHLAGISPFDGEMRRRVWLNIFQIDALMSFQMGFPSMIPSEFCDAEVPRNLEYSDLYVDMPKLPPSRPLADNTPMLYTIVKASIMTIFKKIVAHTQGLSPESYERTMALDAEMKQAYDTVPALMKRRDVNRSFLDHASLIWQRCTVEVLYLKGLIVLHRRYIKYEVQSSAYEQSRRTCVEAALDILSRQADLHKACEPGGRLYEDRWMIYAIPAHDFLLAAMVLCLDLSVRMRSRLESNGVLGQVDDREYQALQTSQRIWAVNSVASPDAHIAALALELMISKVAEKHSPIVSGNDMIGDSHMAAGLELPYAGPMSQMIDASGDIDWALLDQYLQNIEPSATNADSLVLQS